ncbi:MAG: hypothetical protein NQ127_00850 [Candidatus Cardinium sp.]|nr:hypothetical protein [Candidatus Cardinium sp.]
MKNKMIQLRKYYMGCFFTLALISCGKLTNQARRQARKAESTEERKSVRPQRNTMLSGIFNRQTFIMALLAASQIQLGSSTENANTKIEKINFTPPEHYILPISTPNETLTDEDIKHLINTWVCNYAKGDPLYLNHIMVTDEEYRSKKHMNITTECSRKNSTFTSECKQICLDNLKSVFDKAFDKSKDQTGSHVTIHDIPDQGYKTNGISGQTLTRFNYPNYTFVHTNSSGQHEYYALYKSLRITRCKKASCPYTHEIDYVSTFDVIQEKCSDPDLNPEALRETFQELMQEILANHDQLKTWCDTPGKEDLANAVITRILHLHRGIQVVNKSIELQKGFEEFLNTIKQKHNDAPKSTTGRTTTTTPGLFSSTFPSSTISESDYADVVYEKELTQENQQAERGKIEKESQQAQRKKRQTEEKHKQKSKQKKQRKPFSRHR